MKQTKPCVRRTFRETRRLMEPGANRWCPIQELSKSREEAS
jgi:hypothetical protein